MRTALLFPIILILGSCTTQNRGRDILDRAFEAHGAQNLARAIMHFDFRGDRYTARRDDGVFSYERLYDDSLGVVRDVLTNEGVYREIDGVRQTLDERSRYSILEKVNSVIYFASLPYPLKDPAVKTRYLGKAIVADQPYHRVEVTFRQESGGPDYQDRFVYWVQTETDLIDYLAYYYLTNETGSRFRKLVNPRETNGFRAVDHINYAVRPDTIGAAVEQFAELYERGELELVSEVKHENFRIVPLN